VIVKAAVKYGINPIMPRGINRAFVESVLRITTQTRTDSHNAGTDWRQPPHPVFRTVSTESTLSHYATASGLRRFASARLAGKVKRSFK
jgi:hypothetical protein